MKKSVLMVSLIAVLGLVGCSSSSTGESTNSDQTSSNDEPTTSSSTSSSSSLTDEITKEEFTTAVSSAVEVHDSVKTGHVSKTTYYMQDGEEESTGTDNADFEYGSDLVKIESESATTYVFEYEEEPLAIQVVDGSYSLSYQEYLDIGYAFTNVFGYFNGSDFYGIENLLDGLYSFGLDNVNKDLKLSYVDGKYSFDFGYFDDSDGSPYSYYVSSVSFGVDKTSGIISSLDFTKLVYYSSSFTYDDEIKTVTLNENAEYGDKYVYKITQVAGDRTLVNPIKINDLLISSFTLNYENEAVTSESILDLNKNDSILLNVEVLPDTAIIDLDEFNVVVTDSEGNVASGVSGEYASSMWDEGIKISADSSAAKGVYTVSVTTTKVTTPVTFKVNVKEVAPESITITYGTSAGNNVYTSEGLEPDEHDIDLYVGVSLVIAPSVSPYNASQATTASVTSGKEGTYTFELKESKLSEWADPTEYYNFTATEAGDYKIKYVSTEDENVYNEFNVHVKDFNLQEVLSSNDYYVSGKYEFSFTPENSSNTSGNVVVKDLANKVKKTGTYSYQEVEGGKGEIILKDSEGNSLLGENDSLLIGDDYSLVLKYEDEDYEGETQTYYVGLRVLTDLAKISGNWEATVGDYKLSITIYSAEISVNFYNFNTYDPYLSGQFEYNVEGNVITVGASDGYSDLGDIVKEGTILTFDADGFKLTVPEFTYEGTAYNFVLER